MDFDICLLKVGNLRTLLTWQAENEHDGLGPFLYYKDPCENFILVIYDARPNEVVVKVNDYVRSADTQYPKLKLIKLCVDLIQLTLYPIDIRIIWTYPGEE